MFGWRRALVKTTKESTPNKPAVIPDTSRLFVTITEDFKGKMEVEYYAMSVERQVQIKMRPSHIAGQLTAAVLMILYGDASNQEPPDANEPTKR